MMLTSLLPVSCQREEMREQASERPADRYEGQQVTVYFGVEAKPEASTRALGETPDITSLHVAVFGSSGYLKEYKLATPVPENDYVSAEGEANKRGYKVDLSITSSRVRVHLIANGPASLDFDYESTVMAKLTCTAGQDAYWQRIILDHGIYADADAPGYYSTPPVLTLDPDFDLAEDGVTHKMALIPLIRNYAKILVMADDVAESNLEINSFAVVNVPDKGSIAPYNPSNGEFMMNYYDYATLDDLSAVYPGHMPGGSSIIKTAPTETDFTNLTNGVVANGGAVYMYERPVPASDATILVVKGTYHDPESGDIYTGYYKIDMMKGGAYLPILRNFRYVIHIKKVFRKGKNTVAGAINGAGSADISADISTASQVNLSDGNSAISVEYTEKTLPIGGTYTLGVTFTEDVSTQTVNNSLVTYELLAPDANGAVIASENDISYDASTGTITDTTTEVDAVKSKSQKIRVIGTSATSRLYRDVTIKLLPQQHMTVSCISEIEAVAGTAQTITVSIPQDLPVSIFPLQFKVEIAAKSLTPNAADLPVEPDETIVEGSSGRSYQFIKTISYSDYLAAYANGVSTFTCSFKSVIGESDSEVYVANQYFATASTSFTTFVKRYFSSLRFSTAAAINEDDPVNFLFVMDNEHDTGDKLIPEVVDVYLTGLVPDFDNYDDELQRVSGSHYVYTVTRPGTGTQTLHLLSTGETPFYEVNLSAEYYADNGLINDPMEFTNPTIGTVLYGIGWPVSFSFTIPDTYEMPGVGYIDIELGLTNLVPDDGNIIEDLLNGKYYYRATSKGTKTISFKTADSQTAAVAVQLSHSDFVTAIGTQSTRSYLNIASGKITNSGPNNSLRSYNNTVNIYTNKALSSQVSSYTTNTGSWSSYASATNSTAADFASNVVDANQSLYLSMYSRYNTTTYYASTTAQQLYNNGGNSTVTFTTTPPGTSIVTISTTSTNYSTSDLTQTQDGVTASFSVLNSVGGTYATVSSSSTDLTVSVPAGSHITSIVINYSGNSYYANSVSVQSGGGSYSRSGTVGTWTASNSTTTSAVLRLNKRNNYNIRIASVVVTVVED